MKWHQDIQYWPHTNYSPLTIGVYMDDVGDEQGPLAVIPGSQDGELYSLYDASDQWVGSLSDADARAAGDERPEYRIRHRAGQHWVSVGGIRSTGLSAALGIARHVSRLMDLAQAGFAPVADPVIPTVPNLAEHRPRDWQVPGYGEIVCHCEMVTDREIRAALSGEVPAKSLDGLKRRTRATMGRCQGFNCTARLSELADSVFSAPISVGAAHE